MVVICLLLLTGLGYLVYESQHRIGYCPCSKNGREMEFEQYEAGYAEGYFCKLLLTDAQLPHKVKTFYHKKWSN